MVLQALHTIMSFPSDVLDHIHAERNPPTHKAPIPILTMLALAASVLLTVGPEISDAELEHIFYEGDYCYLALDDGEAGILMLNTVTAIMDSVFEETDIGSVTIADSVREIGGFDFSFCPLLTSVIMGGGIEKIGNYRFYNCPRLDHVEFPPAMSALGKPFTEKIATRIGLDRI